ncbi:MAG: SIMPL domain-containing protein [Alphaproteobacteria bacterium]|nr:SIMPL domain-containing protein [Alphaproteobacteria bacterium]
MQFRLWIVPALAMALCAPQLAAAQTTLPPRVITMSGHGEARAVPDTAMLSAGVSAQASTAAAALAANTTRMQAVLAALKKQGVPDKDIQTSNFSISPQYANGNGQAPHVTGYQANNQVEVRLEDVSKLGVMLDALVTAGANQMNGVSFSIRNDTALLAQARAAAVAEARAKAETFAKAAGVSLGAILSIGETGNEGPQPMYAAAPMMMRDKAVPVALGEQSVNADITIVWEIK